MIVKISFKRDKSRHFFKEPLLKALRTSYEDWICLKKNLIPNSIPISISSSQRLQNLAAALSPAGVRIGGTYSDFLHFDPTSDDANCVDVTEPGKNIQDSDSVVIAVEEARQMKRASFSIGNLGFTMSGIQRRWRLFI